MSNDLISVIIPTLDAEEYIYESISSILNQTYKNIEVLVIDDGSTDSTLDIVQSINDSRIRIIKGPKKGISAALNKGILEAKGKYIARMDADDCCFTDRFEKQVKVFDDHSDAGVVAGNVLITGSSFWGHYFTPKDIRTALLFEFPLCHPSIMFKREIFVKNNLFYNEQYKNTEDFELFNRVSEITNIYMTEDFVLRYRMHANQATFKGDHGYKNYLSIIKASFSRRFNISLPEDLLQIFWNEQLVFNSQKYLFFQLIKVFSKAARDRRYNKKIISDFIINKYISHTKRNKIFSMRMFLKFLIHTAWLIRR